MRYGIRAHRLYMDGRPVPYRPTPNRTPGFILHPEGILLHDTAGRLDGDSSVAWFCRREARASAHLVIYRDGRVVQLAPFDAKTWHVGRSSLYGRSGVNNFAIGIEIVNPGRLEPLGNGSYRAWFGEIYDARDYRIIERETPQHGFGGWMDYTPAQLRAVEEICVVLFARYGLRWIWPHWKVSPGRKIDTNPLFPLRHLQSHLLGRQDDAQSSGVMLANTNQRRWPSYADNVIQVIPRGSEVEVLRSGWYTNDGERARWYLVSWRGREGWVHGSLIELV